MREPWFAVYWCDRSSWTRWVISPRCLCSALHISPSEHVNTVLSVVPLSSTLSLEPSLSSRRQYVSCILYKSIICKLIVSVQLWSIQWRQRPYLCWCLYTWALNNQGQDWGRLSIGISLHKTYSNHQWNPQNVPLPIIAYWLSFPNKSRWCIHTELNLG